VVLDDKEEEEEEEKNKKARNTFRLNILAVRPEGK
jgi:hypothetical protein